VRHIREKEPNPKNSQSAKFGGVAVFGVWFLCVLLADSVADEVRESNFFLFTPKSRPWAFQSRIMLLRQGAQVRANYYVTRSTLGLAVTARHNRLPCTSQIEPIQPDLDGQVRGVLLRGVLARRPLLNLPHDTQVVLRNSVPAGLVRGNFIASSSVFALSCVRYKK